MMNDDRNDTQYSCVTVTSTVNNPTVADVVTESNSTILYVAGEYQYNVMYIATYCMYVHWNAQL